MAKEVGLLEEYKVMYFRLSEIEHTGSNSINKFLKRNQVSVQLMIKPRDEDIPKTIISSADYLRCVPHRNPCTFPCCSVSARGLAETSEIFSCFLGASATVQT